MPPLRHRGLTKQLGDEVPIGVKHLQAIVARVGHINHPGLIDGDAAGAVELPIPTARAAEFHQEAALSRELLDAIVAPVGDVHIALFVNGDTPGHVELTVTAARRAPLADELAIFGELLYA